MARKLIKISLAFVIFIACSSILKMKIEAQEAYDNNENFYNIHNENKNQYIVDDFTCDQYISVNYIEKPYRPYEEIIVDFIVISSCDIEKITYNNAEFVNVSIKEKEEKKISVSLQFSAQDVKHCFQLIIKLSNNVYLTGNIYGFKSNDFYFLTKAKDPNKELLYYEYEFELGRITLEDYEKIVIDKTIINTTDEAFRRVKNENCRTRFNDSTVTLIEGVCEWFDGSVFRPLKNTLLNIHYPTEGVGCTSTVTTSTYTDENGEFSVELWLTETVEITIELRSESEGIIVKKNALNNSYSTSRGPIIVNPGENIVDYNFTITTSSTSTRAFEVLQALNYGYRYVNDVVNEEPSTTTCHFPIDGAEYNPITNVINMPEDAHNYWDIILHEYGHKIANYFDITEYYSIVTHNIPNDLIDLYGKTTGMVASWDEGFSTFFSIIVTQYYGNELIYMDKVNDEDFNNYIYSSIGTIIPQPYPLETNNYFGEGCEGAICSVLYDLYDTYSSTEIWDNISLGHEQIMNIIINSGGKSLSQFISYLLTTNVLNIHDGKLGDILSKYEISAYNVRIEDSGFSSSPYKIVWNAGGGTKYPNNSFYLIFYDNNNNMLSQTYSFGATEYTIPESFWEQLIISSNSYITVSVVSSQTASPTTGPYYSEKIRIDLPDHVHQYTYSYSQSSALNHIAYCICGASKTESHIFQAFKNGNRCTKCLYFTTGPISGGQILGINTNILYLEEKEDYV